MLRTYGRIGTGKQISHLCNNPQCVNPKHLTESTMHENQRYKATSLRAGKKLTPAKVRKIREALKRGIPQHEIARDFGICQMNISFIHRGKIWGHVS